MWEKQRKALNQGQSFKDQAEKEGEADKCPFPATQVLRPSSGVMCAGRVPRFCMMDSQ